MQRAEASLGLDTVQRRGDWPERCPQTVLRAQSERQGEASARRALPKEQLIIGRKRPSWAPTLRPSCCKAPS